jgi:hypothetical protein
MSHVRRTNEPSAATCEKQNRVVGSNGRLRFPLQGDEGAVIRHSGDMELKRAFLLAATVASVVAASESSFISDARQITFEGKAGEGYFSPDGSQLIFQSVREPGNPFYQMYILSFETGDLHRVSPGIGKTTCGFFRPGSDEEAGGRTGVYRQRANPALFVGLR